MRFDDAIIEKLLELKWWNWDIDRIFENKEFFQKKLSKEDLDKLLTSFINTTRLYGS